MFKYLQSCKRKAKWLIVCSIIYTIIALAALFAGKWETLVYGIQTVFVIITSTPLWIRPLGNWVFERGEQT